jgi:uncharacterized protein (DUF58 family)
MEGIISAAGSIAWWGLDRGCEVSLMTNGVRTPHGSPILIPPASGDPQFSVILDALGRIEAVDRWDIANVLRLDSLMPATNGSLVLCSSVVTDDMARALADLAQSRHVVLALIDTKLSPSIPGVVVVYGRSGEQAVA